MDMLDLRRRAMMAGIPWAKEPLEIYTAPSKALAAGSFYEAPAEIGDNSSILGSYGEDGITIFDIRNCRSFAIGSIDATRYRKLFITYEAGGFLTKRAYSFNSVMRNSGLGFGVDGTQDDYEGYFNANAASGEHTAEFDISKFKGEIFIKGYVNDSFWNGENDYTGYIEVLKIWLE